MRSVFIRRIKYNINCKTSKFKAGKYIIVLLIIAIFLFFYNAYCNFFIPQIKKIGESNAINICSSAIDKGVYNVLKREKISYTDLVTYLKDENDNISGIMVNLIAINRLKGEFSLEISNCIDKIRETSIEIPMGNLVGNELFSGMGKKIKIKLIPANIIFTNFKNSFEETGINQTRHEIYLEVKLSVNLLMPGKKSISKTVLSKIPLVENIVVGKVPESYTKLDTDRENMVDDFLNIYN